MSARCSTGNVADAVVLVGECLAARPLEASLRFCGRALDTVKGRLFRGLNLYQPPRLLYTETIW